MHLPEGNSHGARSLLKSEAKEFLERLGLMISEWLEGRVGGEWEPDQPTMADNTHLSMSACWYSPNSSY
jgi:hypothetical protein